MQLGYMVVTLHFINASWDMISAIIGFVRVLYPHTSDRLASTLFECVRNMLLDLLQSVWCITADDAITNPAMTLVIPLGQLRKCAQNRSNVGHMSIVGQIQLKQI